MDVDTAIQNIREDLEYVPDPEDVERFANMAYTAVVQLLHLSYLRPVTWRVTTRMTEALITGVSKQTGFRQHRLTMAVKNRMLGIAREREARCFQEVSWPWWHLGMWIHYGNRPVIKCLESGPLFKGLDLHWVREGAVVEVTW
jgi:hypothetical protein